MSLGKIKTGLKTGAEDLTTQAGLKKVGLHLGLGVAIGAIIFLIIRAIFINLLYAKAGLNWRHEDGISPPFVWRMSQDPDTYLSIFPDGRALMYDEVLLIIITVLTLTAKKLWFTVGFFLGWYGADYLGLYSSFDLPVPEEPFP